MDEQAQFGQSVPAHRLGDFVGVRRVSEQWFRISQERINAFADATLDHQYIHVDPERAARSPFGSTIAHGFLTLSLLPVLLEPIQIAPEGVVMGINYGMNRVRFPSHVPVDSEIRACATLLEVSHPAPDRTLLTSKIEIEIRGADKPALVAESLAMFVTAGPTGGSLD